MIATVESELLPGLRLTSINPYDPVVVEAAPAPWEFVGAGNYAAVFAHPDWPDWVAKVYAPGRPGLREEVEVYRQLGDHPAYSACRHAGENYLILRRLRGMTLFECLVRGVRIPAQVIEDIDEALAFARERGLHPRDVHAKNVMMLEGRGLVADVSDFGRGSSDQKWADFKRAYCRFYRPWLGRRPVPIPRWLLDLIRKSYRLYVTYLGRSD